MEGKTHYKTVGLMVIFLSTALLVFSLWLSIGFNQKSYDTYIVYIHEAVTGLNEEAPVKFNGVPIGFVKKIQLNNDDPRQVRLFLNIESGTPITESTTATLISQGITGVSFVGLTATSSKLSPLKLLPGEKYPIIPSRPSLFNQFDKAIKDVSENINKVSVEIRRIFDKDNADHLKQILSNIASITKAVAANDKQITEMLADSHHLLKSLNQSASDLPHTLQTLNHFLINATHASQAFESTMNTGTIITKQFSQETLPLVNNTLKKMDRIANHLETASQMIQQNPSVIIRGNTTPQKGPGE